MSGFFFLKSGKQKTISDTIQNHGQIGSGKSAAYNVSGITGRIATSKSHSMAAKLDHGITAETAHFIMIPFVTATGHNCVFTGLTEFFL
ncbi:hypothetical protein ADUPG1_005809, partial [Aduncisulcus paluster]